MGEMVQEVQRALYPVFVEYGIKNAVLFGSIAKGKETEQSDIDLVVDSGLRGLKFVGFIEAIRRAVHREADVFDRTHIISGSLLDQEVKQTGILIYEK